MRLVTFVNEEGLELAGALFDQDQAVLDLQKAYTVLKGGQSAALSSVLAQGHADEEGVVVGARATYEGPRRGSRRRECRHRASPLRHSPADPRLSDFSAS